LILSNSLISGTLPTQLANSSSLNRLKISSSRKLSGTLPSGLNQLQTLVDFAISFNDKISGTFPDLSQLKRLQTIEITSNPLLSGSLTGVTALRQLSSLVVYNNHPSFSLFGANFTGLSSLQSANIAGAFGNSLSSLCAIAGNGIFVNCSLSYPGQAVASNANCPTGQLPSSCGPCFLGEMLCAPNTRSPTALPTTVAPTELPTSAPTPIPPPPFRSTVNGLAVGIGVGALVIILLFAAGCYIQHRIRTTQALIVTNVKETIKVNGEKLQRSMQRSLKGRPASYVELDPNGDPASGATQQWADGDETRAANDAPQTQSNEEPLSMSAYMLPMTGLKPGNDSPQEPGKTASIAQPPQTSAPLSMSAYIVQ
jgi:hypothetical protein